MDDERLAKIEQEKQNAINQSNNMYNGLLQDNQNIYDQQQEYANQYEKTQNEALDKQLAFNEQKINQQKEIARQNFETEQKKAKNDFVSYTNPYGLQAEQFASQGLLNSGVSETAKLGGFNSYQNRLASANKVMQDAYIQYDNDMNQARLNNDVQKAQNALAKLEMQLKYSESFYNNKSTLTQNQLSNNQQLDSDYYNRYNTVYNNIQAEKQRAEAIRQWEAELAEKQRQYNENMAFQKSESQRQQANWEKEYALSKAASARTSTSTRRSSGGSSSTKKSNSSKSSTLTNGSSGNGNYEPTGYSIRNGDVSQELLTKDGKYYYKNGKKYVDISNNIAQLNNDFMTLKDGTVIVR